MIEKTITTTSELVQDNSDVTPETNPMDTVQSNELIFGQKHNDIDCAFVRRQSVHVIVHGLRKLRFANGQE